MKKAVFFDIDGTLVDKHMKMPESTKEAIRQLQKNDVYVFLCSGRAPSFIVNPELLSLGFDGIVAGCGTCVAIGEEEILYKTIEPELMKRTLEILKKHRLPVILEGKYAQYAEEEDFAGDDFFAKLKEEVGDSLLSIRAYDMKWEVSKFCIDIKNAEYEEALQEFGGWYDCIVRGKDLIEVLPKGYNKAFGMQAVCEKLGIQRENTYAFGDSANDVEMLKYAAYGIAMGNGVQEAKAAADYVTDDIYEDGVYNACRHFGLI